MSKNNFSTLFTTKAKKENVSVQEEVSGFYPEGAMADFSFAIDKAKLAESVKDSLTLQTLTQEQMEQECFAIHKKVKQGLPNNVEILFTKGVQFFEKGRYPLGDTVIKLQVMDSDSPCYFYLKAGETLDAGVFIGGDSSAGFLLLKDAAGRDFFIKLTEFHLLSVQESGDPTKEIGLVTSYVWLTAKVFSSVLLASSLDPVKNLLLSEHLAAEWKHSKDAAKDQQLSNEVVKENEHGQKEF